MTNLAALVYAYISLFAARALFFEKKLESPANRIWITWILLAPCIMFIPPGPFYFLCSALILVVLKPVELDDKIIYFIGVLPAAPGFLSYNVPFPGISTLLTLTHWKLSVLVILVPIFISHAGSLRRAKWSKIDRLVVLYVVYISLMTFREWTLTNVLREAADNFLLFFVPYFMITRCLNDLESIQKCIKHIIYLCIILIVLGIVTTLTSWEFYHIFNPSSFYAMRGGNLRIQLTINTASLCTMMSIGLVVLEYLRSSKKHTNSHLMDMGTLRAWMLRALLLAIVLATGNRGGLIQFILSPIIFYILVVFSNAARGWLLFFCLIAVISFVSVLPEIDWGAYDDEGTFEYRYQIFLASLTQFNETPLFGRMDFLDSGNFDHLVQGEGIVDIVNWYLQIVLEFGAVGLILFLGIFYGTIFTLYKELKKTIKSEERRYVLACVLSLLVPYVIVIGTTSNVSFLPIQGILLVALGNAIIHSKYNKQDDSRSIRE